jgi:hypothetical protein
MAGAAQLAADVRATATAVAATLLVHKEANTTAAAAAAARRADFVAVDEVLGSNPGLREVHVSHHAKPLGRCRLCTHSGIHAVWSQ